MGFFIIGLTLVYPFPFMSQVVRFAGIGMIGLYLLILLKYKPLIPPEILLYCSFITWAALTGAIIARNQAAFRDSISTLFQIMILMFAVSGFAKFFGSIKPNLYIILISVIVLDCYVLFTGDLNITNQIQSSVRTSSFLKNPNYYAFFNVLGIFAILYFTNKPKKTFFNIVSGLLVILFLLNILYSSSQKAFLSAILLFISYHWFCYRKRVKKSKRFLYFVLLSIFLFGIIYFTINNSYIGVRLQDSAVGDDASLQTRILLYKEGFEIFLANPVSGIGTANFVEYSSMHAYAHSDFLEVLATTGIIGFLFYTAIYLVLWRRLNLIQKYSNNPETIFQTGLFKAFIVTLTFIGLGRPNFTSIETMFVLASVIGYSAFLLNKVKREKNINKRSIQISTVE